jgi:hypothetical protein
VKQASSVPSSFSSKAEVSQRLMASPGRLPTSHHVEDGLMADQMICEEIAPDCSRKTTAAVTQDSANPVRSLACHG